MGSNVIDVNTYANIKSVGGDSGSSMLLLRGTFELMAVVSQVSLPLSSPPKPLFFFLTIDSGEIERTSKTAEGNEERAREKATQRRVLVCEPLR